MPEAPARAGDEWGCVLLDLPAYLRRIGYDGDLALTGRALAGLHRAHIAAIPFENGDIMLGRGVAVDLPSVAGKLVHRCRGGYCFEHGLLLAAALERLSYRVDRLLARVGGDHDARTHMVLRVHAGQGCWLADTGFGTGLIELRAAGKRRWQLQELLNGQWATLYLFGDQPAYAADILVANHFTSTYPGSHFVRQLVVIRKEMMGLRRLTERRLNIALEGHPSQERRLSDAEFADALTEIFGLQFSDAEATRLTAITRDTDAGDLPGSRT